MSNLSNYQFDLEWTLKLCIRKPDVVDGWTLAHVADLDATLSINHWPVEDGEDDWEIDYGTIDGIKVTAESDPIAWSLIERAKKEDRDRLNEIVQQTSCAREAA